MIYNCVKEKMVKSLVEIANDFETFSSSSSFTLLQGEGGRWEVIEEGILSLIAFFFSSSSFLLT
jgi:hypothetical protein